MRLLMERAEGKTAVQKAASLNPLGRKPTKLMAATCVVTMLGQTPSAAQDANCPNPSIDPSRSIVVTDGALDRERFAFSSTIDAILTSLGIPPDATNRENFVKTLIGSFNAQQFNNSDSGLPMKVDVRGLEAALDPAKLLDPAEPIGLVPIALFNRFDLVPADLSNCGEHRIVYSFKAPIANAGGPPSRFFLIFEARLRNPSPGASPEASFEGCRPVANFWRQLSDVADPALRADQLAQFYYTGIAGAAGPVVQARNFGGPLGQVRGNIFMNSPGAPPKWQLREWIVINSGGTTPATFLPVTVKTNPLAELYQDANPASLSEVLEALERSRFQQDFAGRHTRELLDHEFVSGLGPGDEGYESRLDIDSPDFSEEWYRISLLNKVGARFDNRANEFQSVSQGNEDDPLTVSHLAGGLFLNRASAGLSGIAVAPDRKPTIDEVVDRAGAITCGGCHGFSEGRQVGSLTRRVGGQTVKTTITWPADEGFVHVTEPGGAGGTLLSEALRMAFVPFREDVLKNAVCLEPPAPEVSRMAGAAAATFAAQQNEYQTIIQELSAANAGGNQAERAAAAARVLERTNELREDEIQKPGFFVTNRRPH